MEAKISIERRPQVEQRCGWSTSTLYSYMARGLFPPQVRISKRAVGWLAHEVDAVLQGRVRGLDDIAVKLLVADLVADRLADKPAGKRADR